MTEQTEQPVPISTTIPPNPPIRPTSTAIPPTAVQTFPNPPTPTIVIPATAAPVETPAQSGPDRRTYTALSFAVTSAVLWAITRYVYHSSPIDPQTQAIITTAVSAAVGYATSHFLTRKGVSLSL